MEKYLIVATTCRGRVTRIINILFAMSLVFFVIIVSSTFLLVAVGEAKAEPQPGVQDYVVDRDDPSGLDLLEQYVGAHPDVLAQHLSETMPAEAPLATYSTRDATGCQTFQETGSTVCGAILQHYNAIGGRNSWLGLPTSNELVNPDQAGRRTEFSKGAIYWHPRTGAHAVTRDGMRQWATLGWETGLLGYPTSDPMDTRVVATQYQTFEGGDNYYNPLFGGAVWGDIKAKYDALGGSNHPIGVPMTNEQNPGGGFRFNNFSNGTISWREADRAAHFMFLATQRVWQALGRENGMLGFPSADEVAEIPGAFHFVPFSSTGVIAWNNVLGARELVGQSYAYWQSVRNTAEDLGYPVPTPTPFEESYEQEFTKGIILGMNQGIAVINGSFDALANESSEGESINSKETGTNDITERKYLASPDSAAIVYQRTFSSFLWGDKTFVVRQGLYSTGSQQSFGWGYRKIVGKHNLRNLVILSAVFRYPDDNQTAGGPGNKKLISRVRFLECDEFSVGPGGRCKPVQKTQYITLIYRPRRNLTYMNVPSQTSKEDLLDVGVVTAWCHDQKKDKHAENTHSVCPEYVNGFTKMRRW